MRFASVCSGIEAASVAWRPLGWVPVFYSEIARFPSRVLEIRQPGVPNHGDLNDCTGWPDATFDVLIGGTPCQSFSIAGLRMGLDDARGGLMLAYLACLARYRPRWFVWENVPGVLSIDDGRAFASLLWGVAELRYGWAYRVLDAQYFGVAQRRRRVFVVGCLGGWAAAAQVLFEPESLRGDSPPRRPSGQRRATTLAAGSPSSSGYRNDADTVENLIADTLMAGGNETGGIRPPGSMLDMGNLIAGCVSSKWAKGTGGPAGDECYNLIPFDTSQLTHPENRSNPRPGDPAPTLPARGHGPAVAYNLYPESGQGADLSAKQTDVAMACTTVDAKLHDRGTRVAEHTGVRRLTPRECERLQGFPDDYTLIPMGRQMRRRVDDELAAYLRRVELHTDEQLLLLGRDGPRYHGLGNSIAVPVLRWLGQRLEQVDKLLSRPSADAATRPGLWSKS